MKNSVKLLGIIAIIAIIGFSMAGCDSEVTPVHVHDYEWSVTTPATCIAIGEETGVCKLDSSHTATREIPIDLEDPTMHDYGEWTGTVTCTEAGEGTRVCSRSTEHIETKQLDALGHNYQNWTTTTDSTCTTAGEETGTCTHDQTHKDTRPKAIDPTAHDWQISSGTAPTCTVDGNGIEICSYNQEHIQSGILPKLGHDYQNYTETTAPTCTTTGVETGTCTRDQVTTTRPKAINPNAHNWNNTYTITTPATCTATGIETDTCSYNPAQHTRMQIIAIDPTAHNYNTWQQTTAPTCETAGIESEVCAYNNSHTSGSTRAGAAAIGHDWNTAYTTITAATATTDGLEGITCKNNPAHIKDERIVYATGTPGLAFELITSGTNANTYRVNAGSARSGAVVIPATYSGLPVTEIRNTAFYNTSITSIIIPDSITSIRDDAFNACTSLTSIIIPASVTSIGQWAFANWTSSQTIYVEGFPNQAAANAVWGYSWYVACNAVIVYGIESEIAITQQPYKITYLIGDQLDITGIVVTATYTNGSTGTVTVTAANITGFDSSTEGTKTLTVTYNGKTATFTVSVFDPNNMVVTNTAEWNAALNLLNGKTGNYTLNIGGSFSVARSTYSNPTFGTTANGSTLSVTLKGSGTLSLSSNGTILQVGANQTVIIDSGNLILQGLISNNESLVYVSGTNANLELKNGTISNNIYNNSTSGVGGIGGGVYVGLNSTFTMSGGIISGNTAGRSTGSNTNNGRGGGVNVNGGTFIMTGGLISGNTAYGVGDYGYNNPGAFGGGVHVTGISNSYPGTFTMTGGEISGNKASAFSSNCFAQGGGIYVGSWGIFRIVTGTIYGNNETNTSLRNTVTVSTGSNASGAALYVATGTNPGTAQRGTFSIPGDITSEWNSSGTLSSPTNNTIRVVNGVSQ